MRITIETTDAESRSTVVEQQHSGAVTTGGGTQASAANGGPPPDALLLALGAKTGVEGATRAGPNGGAIAAGEPASWLVESVARGSERRPM